MCAYVHVLNLTFTESARNLSARMPRGTTCIKPHIAQHIWYLGNQHGFESELSRFVRQEHVLSVSLSHFVLDLNLINITNKTVYY